MSDKEKQPKEEELVDFFEVEEIEEDTDTDEEETNKKGEEASEEEEEEEEDQDTTSEEEKDQDQDNEEEEKEEEEDDSIVGSLKESFGYDFEEEFEDTEEGVMELTRKAAERMAEDYVNSQFEENPVMKEFFEYVDEGGDPQYFLNTKFPETDYSQVEFDENDSDLQEKLVKEELVARGYSGEELKTELKDIKDGGLLENKAKRALGFLKSKQENERKNILEQQKQENATKQEEIKKFWNDVNDNIKSSKSFKGFKIPESKKDKFFNFLSKPVDNEGRSQRDLKLSELGTEETLAIDWLIFNDFKFSDLIERKAKDMQSKNLRDRLQKSKLDKKRESNKTDTSSGDEELGTI